MKSVEIFFTDLSQKKQEEILLAANVSIPEDMGFNEFPLFIMDFEDSTLS